MAVAQSTKLVITPLDRFGLTLSLAILVHALIILGITFIEEDRSRTRYNTMEIILVQQESPEPKDAEMLAQANLEGGGDVDEVISPSAPMPTPFPDPKPQITTPPPVETQPPPPAPAVAEVEVPEPAPEKKDVVEKMVVDDELSRETKVEPVEKPGKERELTEQKEIKIREVTSSPQREKIETREVVKKPNLPSATELLTNSLKTASLSAEIRHRMENRANRPRRKFISATTKEYNYAAYMEAWRSKVERVGNLNYPDEARRQKLSGSLILDVALNADGSINEITIRRSSGEKMLDDAAIRIVELAVPYAPFPQHIKDETDILHIMRTWQFINNRGFR